MTIESLLRKFTFLAISFLSASIALAVFGGFNEQNITYLIYGSIGVTIIFAIKNFFLNKARLKAKPADIAIIAAILLFLSTAFFFHHDYNRGRDEMVHLVSASILNETGTLSFTDDATHPYTGFTNIEGNTFTPQFLPGYITNIALFFSAENIELTYLVNPITLFFGLIAIYFLGKKFRSNLTGIVATTWLMSFYGFIWFSRRLNSEILFFSLIWVTLWYFYTAIKSKKIVWYYLSFLPLSLLILVRGEGLLYIAAYTLFSAFYIFQLPKANKERIAKKRHLLLLTLPLLNMITLAAYLIKFNNQYLADQIRNFEAAFTSFSPLLIGTVLLFTAGVLALYFFVKKQYDFDFKKEKQRILLAIILLGVFAIKAYQLFSTNFAELKWSFYRIQFTIEIFILYFLFIFILFIFRGLFKKSFNKDHFYLTLFLSPAFIFIVESNIAPDQPWFLRRYIAVLIPYFIFMAAYAFMKIKTIPEKKIALFVSVILVNLLVASPILFFIENKNTKAQIEDMVSNVGENDLILMEPGWDWQKWAYSMKYIYGKQTIPNLNLQYIDVHIKPELQTTAVEFPEWRTNIDHLKEIKKVHLEAQKELLQPFIDESENVYILSTSPFNYPFYDVLNLETKKEIDFTYQTLQPTTRLLGHIQTSGHDLDIHKIRKSQKFTPPRVIKQEELNLLLLKVKDKEKTVLQTEFTEGDAIAYRDYLERLFK